MIAAMNVLALNSQVVFGHVGNSAAQFALQRLGFEVWAVPTVVLSNHPAHGSHRGRATEPADFAALIEGLADLGALGRCDGVCSGYLGEASLADVVAGAARRVRAANPSATYLCDPVLGDAARGAYVPDSVREAVVGRLVPSADILTPNAFELGAIAGAPVHSLADALGAARMVIDRGPRIVVGTSLEVSGDTVATLAVSAGEAFAVRTPRLDGQFYGAGDLLAALFLGHTLAGAGVAESLSSAVSSVFGVIAASAPSSGGELALVAAQDQLVAPDRSFRAAAVG